MRFGKKTPLTSAVNYTLASLIGLLRYKQRGELINRFDLKNYPLLIKEEIKFMSLVRYNPWQEISSLQDHLNRLFDSTLDLETWDKLNNLSRFPAAELTDSENALNLRLEVPGIKPEDLDIQVMADRVAIAGERKSTISSETASKTKSEFRYGSFQRVIPLPARIQNTEVTAKYEDGVLNLTLPKSEAEKNKVVKVNLAESKQQTNS